MKYIIIPIALILVSTILFGYYNNIAKLVELDFEKPYKAEILRGVGLIPPVGMIMGYVEFEEEK